MTSPLRITFDVACPAEHAFAMWTSRIGTWWPPDHTVTGDQDLAIVLEAASAAGSTNGQPRGPSTTGAS